MSEIEKKIITVRKKASSINQLSESDLKADIDLLIFKASAICGADLPATDFFANILSREISYFLLEFGYSEYNVEELLLAFYLNSNGIKLATGEVPDKIYFKGVLSVSLMADVLSNYKSLRNTLDRKLQNQIDGYE